MKRRFTMLLAVVAALGFMTGLYGVPAAQTAVTLEVLRGQGGQ